MEFLLLRTSRRNKEHGVSVERNAMRPQTSRTHLSQKVPCNEVHLPRMQASQDKPSGWNFFCWPLGPCPTATGVSHSTRAPYISFKGLCNCPVSAELCSDITMQLTWVEHRKSMPAHMQQSLDRPARKSGGPYKVRVAIEQERSLGLAAGCQSSNFNPGLWSCPHPPLGPRSAACRWGRRRT